MCCSIGMPSSLYFYLLHELCQIFPLNIIKKSMDKYLVNIVKKTEQFMGIIYICDIDVSTCEE